jgi:phage N-6-adenine-methyltransferase
VIVNTELAQSKGCEQKDKWETPNSLFHMLNNEFDFNLDPCCEDSTAKCALYYTEEMNGLNKSWAGKRVFVNPPYSRGNIERWMKKCYEESLNGTLIVALIPVSTSAKWFHDYVWMKAEIRFLKGRIRFVGAPFTAPFSSCIAVYNPPIRRELGSYSSNGLTITKNK